MLYRSRERSSTPSIIIQVKAWGSTTTQDLPHPHNTDVFEELDTSHGSGWQYELQQLKFANQRLYGNSRHLSRIDFKKIHFRLLVLNVYDRFYPLRGLVVVTAIGVRHLNCASMRDRDRLNVLGGRYEWFAFMDGIIVSHTIVCFLSSSPIHE